MWKKEEYGKSKKRCGRKKNTIIYLPKREAEECSCPDWCGVCSRPTPSALCAPAWKIQKQEMSLRSCLCLILVPVLDSYIPGKCWKDYLNLFLRIVYILLRCVLWDCLQMGLLLPGLSRARTTYSRDSLQPGLPTAGTVYNWDHQQLGVFTAGTHYSQDCLQLELPTAGTVYSWNCLQLGLFTAVIAHSPDCLAPRLFTTGTVYSQDCLQLKLLTPGTIYSQDSL